MIDNERVFLIVAIVWGLVSTALNIWQGKKLDEIFYLYVYDERKIRRLMDKIRLLLLENNNIECHKCMNDLIVSTNGVIYCPICDSKHGEEK